MSKWRWAASSVQGSAHKLNNTRKQDAYSAFTLGDFDQVFVSIISDGAGSATMGGQGASLTCRSLSQNIRAHFKQDPHFPNEERVREWIDEIRDAISFAAQRRDISIRDFACTLVLVIANKSEVMCAHVGDGGIIGRVDSTKEFEVLSHPENGMYASTTYFITDEIDVRLRISNTENTFDSIITFSDGIETLAFDLADGIPFPAWLNPMVSPIQRLTKEGRSKILSDKLNSYLSSTAVTSRTQDDITLVISAK